MIQKICDFCGRKVGKGGCLVTLDNAEHRDLCTYCASPVRDNAPMLLDTNAIMCEKCFGVISKFTKSVNMLLKLV